MCRSVAQTCGICLIVALMPAPPTEATPYLISYEADTPGSFPEDERWQRFTTGGGVSRTVENGILTLQAINEPPNGGSDQYVYDMQEQLNPDPGEYFFAEWRMRVLPGSMDEDVKVYIAPDGMERAFTGRFAESYFYAPRDDLVVDLDVTMFHTYRIESANMEYYSLFIDGGWVWDGSFTVGTIVSSVVNFGDGLVSSTSGSQWDYFRFGAVPVPIPGALTLLGPGLGIIGALNARRHRLFPR